MSTREVTSRLREKVWNGSIPLEIRLDRNDCRTYDESDPYLVRCIYTLCLALHELQPSIHSSDILEHEDNMFANDII